MSAATGTVGRTRAAAPEARYAVYVWDLPLRVIHWTLALSLFVLAATGFAIGHPFFRARRGRSLRDRPWAVHF
jgi:Ni,Fe-hydrogenase I cytochrome b subunit